MPNLSSCLSIPVAACGLCRSVESADKSGRLHFLFQCFKSNQFETVLISLVLYYYNIQDAFRSDCSLTEGDVENQTARGFD